MPFFVSRSGLLVGSSQTNPACLTLDFLPPFNYTQSMKTTQLTPYQEVKKAASDQAKKSERREGKRLAKSAFLRSLYNR